MSDEATSKSGKTWLYVTGVFVSLPLLYALSSGPAQVLLARSIISVPAFEAAYWPLYKLVDVTGTHRIAYRYAELWFGLTGTTGLALIE